MTTCIPIAHGVPALSGPPNWFDNSVPVPQFWDRFDEFSDPRWRGAARKGFGVGTVEHLGFRALHSPVTAPPAGTPTAYLYLAWDIDVDPSVDLNSDGVYLGLQRTGGPAYKFAITAWSSAADKLTATPTAGRTVTKLVGSTWVAEPEPTWVNGTARAWLKNMSASVTTNKWAIHLRVPLIDSGDITNVGINLGPIGSAFKLWFEVDLDHVAGGVAPYAFPAGALITQDPVTLDDVFPLPGTWGDASVGGTNCGLGVSLDGSSIGTMNPDPTEILYEWPIDMATPNPTNQLFAKPKNTGPTIAAHALKATFRTANWGTQPDWNAVPNPTTTLWKEVLPATDKDNALGIAAGVESPPGSGNFTPSEGTIQFPWTLGDTEAAEFEGPSATRRKHQCMYVELSGAGIDFLNDSAYQNMNFAQASEFTSEAEASVAGLQAIAGSTHRDVFLFVDTRNMPETVSQAEQPKPAPEEPPSDDEIHEAPVAGGGTLDGQVIATSVVQRPQSYEDLARTAPTYMVHAFHDTGLKRRINGVVKPVLAPQTSFGYFVEHTGALHGWEHELSGPSLQKLTDNYYKIRVPNGGSVPLRIRINALEKPRPWWWWFWKLIRRIIAWFVALIRKLLGQ
jgi:hypothetical protein